MDAGRNSGQLDLRAAARFAAAAARTGVERVCYLGGLVPKDADSEHIVSRRETGEVLRRGRVPVTGIRAGIIVGPGSAAFEVMRDLVYHLPVMVTPRRVRTKSPPALSNQRRVHRAGAGGKEGQVRPHVPAGRWPRARSRERSAGDTGNAWSGPHRRRGRHAVLEPGTRPQGS
jgi:hypothetical protein